MANNLTDSTLKIKGLPQFTEKEWAQYKYDTALKTMLAKPTQANIELFEDANRNLFEVQDAYRIGTRLLLQRAKLSVDLIILTRRVRWLAGFTSPIMKPNKFK